VRENPISAAMAGIGLGMLAVKARQSTGYARPDDGRRSWRRPTDEAAYYRADESRDTSYTAEAADRAADAYGRTKRAVSDTAERVQEVAGESYDAARRTVSDMSSRAGSYSQDLFTRNPLLMSAAAIVAGAAIGLSLPETESENQWMGETRDSLVERAQEAAQDAVEKVKDVAGEAARNLGQ